MRGRRHLAAVAALVLLGGAAGAVVSARPVSAITSYLPLASTPDGAPGSLRDVLEHQVADNDGVVLESGATYRLTDCAAGDLDISVSVWIEAPGGATIEQTCDDRVIETTDSIWIAGVTVTGGRTTDGGGGIRSDAPPGSQVMIRYSTLTGNVACGEGGGVEVATDANVFVVDSTLSGNTAAEASGVDLHAGGNLFVFNSTVSGNTAERHGALSIEGAPGRILLVYATVVDNAVASPGSICAEAAAADAADAGGADAPPVDGEPANIGFDAANVQLVSFGSVIARPVGGPNCGSGPRGASGAGALEAPELRGYSYSDDASCGLLAATDRQDAPDPLLGPLAANGGNAGTGETLTHLPQPGSPLVDAIPVDACPAVDDFGDPVSSDQRARPRPSPAGGACDIGSVEVQTELPVELQPMFTG